MSGSNILIQISEINSVLSASREKLKKLLAAKSKVDTIEIALKYIPENAESIKDSYNLYGAPYDVMATDEKQVVTQANTDFKKVRDTVSNELEQAIKQENTIISSNNNLLESLLKQPSFFKKLRRRV